MTRIITCIEQFNPRRCMFESNFPVDKVSYSYNVLYNAFKRLSQGYSPAERRPFPLHRGPCLSTTAPPSPPSPLLSLFPLSSPPPSN